MSVAIALVGFIVALFVMMSSHELGHMVAAKRAGVVVEEFGIGFPPRLFAVKRGQTSYSVNLIPLGAFVRTPGENDPTVPGSLASKGPWTRMAVYAAGPLVNILLAFVALSAFFMLPTEVIRGDGVMVFSVSEDSPAEEAGIESGDIIQSIDGQQIREWQDVQDLVNQDGGKAKALILVRSEGSGESTSEQQLQITLEPKYDSDLGRYAIGVLLCWGIVTGVADGSPAEAAGIESGDTILGIDGEAVYSDETVLNALDSAVAGQTVEVVLLRGGEVVSASLQLGSEDVGVHSSWVTDTRIEKERVAFWQALYRGGDYIVHVPYLIKESIPIIREDPSKGLVGVVGAGQLTVEAVKSSGFSNVLLLAGIISIGLALFNFIPIPPLDGGGMLIGLIEGLRGGKRLSPKTVRLAYMAGTALMIALFVLIMYNDIARLISGGSFLE
ncbi:MAG: RIP metalloprotease RseP [Chloroflexi bacterium RBG_13_54_8]|nr:MAG: RIP metalloprotease RseP [Chloroflexi bacterium RBG_13_54_8]